MKNILKNVYCQSHSIPRAKVQMTNLASLCFQGKDGDEIEESIEKNFSKAFVRAWNDIETNLVSLPPCYRSAFYDYKELIRYNYGNQIVINFDFTPLLSKINEILNFG